jgi:hypothetical protein
MSKFVDSLLLNGKLRRHQRLDQIDDRLRADMGLPSDHLRRAQPFIIGSLILR